MKIGVLSDTHLRTMPLGLEKTILTYFMAVDMIFHAGDVVDTQALEIFDTSELHLVAGNMDSLEIKEKYPAKKVLTVAGFKIGMIHGWGPPSGMEQRIRGEFGDVDCIVFGHTHTPCNRRIGKILFFNPGTATDRRSAGMNSLGILRTGDHIDGEIIYL